MDALRARAGLAILWVTLNLTAYVGHWAPYPFILLDLALSFQAAYAPSDNVTLKARNSD